MNRKSIADWMLMLSIGVGLFQSYALAGLAIAVAVRGDLMRVDWRPHHTFLALAAAWAAFVLSVRGASDHKGALLYYGYLWVLPFLLAIYKPDEATVARFGRFILALFVVDLAFNVFSLALGRDVFDRIVDARSGVLGGRHGGIFAHSFYSGSISIAAFIVLLANRRLRWLLIGLPVANLLLAGSWRLTIAIPMLLLFAYRWRTRTRVVESLMAFATTGVVIAGVVATSGFVPAGLEENGSNALRVFAWLNSAAKVASSPATGIGFPDDKAIAETGVSYESIDENLIAESWYLGSAITFGVPYTVLSLFALFSAFLGKGFEQRDIQRATLFPFILIDLAYGNFFGTVLIYTWMWLLVGAPARDHDTLDQRHRRRLRSRAKTSAASVVT